MRKLLITFRVLLIVCLLFMLWLQLFPPHHKIVRSLPVHKTLYLASNIYGEQTNEIASAVIEWNTATHGQVVFDIVPITDATEIKEPALVVINVPVDDPRIMVLDRANSHSTMGYFADDQVPYIALVKDRMEDGDMAPVVLHELGHALGLQHPNSLAHPYDGVGSLMFASMSGGSKHLTNQDMAQFCKLYACNSWEYNVEKGE
jgi:hypothetical protein